MKIIAIIALIGLTGCSAALKLPGTKDPETQKIEALVRAIEKQSDTIVAIVGKAQPEKAKTCISADGLNVIPCVPEEKK